MWWGILRSNDLYIICDSNLKLHSLKTLEFLINDGHKVYFYSNKLYFKRLLKFTIEKKGLTIISFIPFLYLLTVLLKRIRIKSGLIDNYLLKGLYLKLKKQLEMIESEYIFISFDYLFMANDVKKNGQAISIIDIRTTLNERSLASNPKLRVLAKNLGYYDIALVPSRIAYDGLKNYFTESRIKILPYGYETNYNPVSKSKRVPLRALFVGRPSNEKGIELIIKLSNFFSNDLLEITVVGGYVGIDRKIPIKFKQMGYLSKSELEHEYINNDVLLAPTRLEGMSYAILELTAATTSRQ